MASVVRRHVNRSTLFNPRFTSFARSLPSSISDNIVERSWLRSQGDFIYGIDVDTATDQARVVRYRLLAPF